MKYMNYFLNKRDLLILQYVFDVSTLKTIIFHIKL